MKKQYSENEIGRWEKFKLGRDDSFSAEKTMAAQDFVFQMEKNKQVGENRGWLGDELSAGKG